MLTRSTLFETYAATSGHQRDVILAITQNSVTYYFSTRPMPRGINSEPVYPMLLEHGEISEGINIFTKQWQVSDVSFTLSDELYYPQDGGTPIRVSELLEGLNGETCEIYQWVDGITDIDDCLLVFSGYILQSLTISKRGASFTAKDRSKLWDTTIPTRIIRDEFPDAPTANATKPIPIVFGDFSVADPYSDNTTTATGLANIVAVESNMNTKYLVADHEVDIIYQVYHDTGGPSVLPCGISSSDRGDPEGDNFAWAKGSQNTITDFFPDATLPAVYDDEVYVEDEAERLKLADNDRFTNCSFADRLGDDGDYADGIALWGIQHEEAFRGHMNNGGHCKGGYKDIIMDTTGGTGNITELFYYIYYGVSGGNDERIECAAASKIGGGDTDVFEWDLHFWRYPGGETYNASISDMETDTPGDVWALGIGWHAGAIASPKWDGVVDNQLIATMADAVLRYYYTVPYQYTTWCSVRGKEVGYLAGSGAGRNNPYGHGDVNQDPCLIIEDLYRMFFSLGDDDIDIVSFDAACNENVQVRMNILSRTKVSDIVQRLSEQSTVVVSASGAGKLRCISLSDKSPTTVANIRRGQLVGDDFRLTKTRQIINNVDVKSRWQPEYQRWLEVENYADTVSEGAVQTRHASFDWENTAGASAAYLAQHYVNSVDGIWSKEHIQVSFETPGFTHSHLQPGDWINFNDNVDELKKAFGVSWQSKQLIITDIQKSMDSVNITAIELYETVAGEPAPSASPSPSPSPGPSPSPSPSPEPSPDDASSPTGDAPWGRYDRVHPASPISLPWYAAMTDDNIAVEIGSDLGYISGTDHYGLEFETPVELDSSASLSWKLDRSLTGSLPLLKSGGVDIHYSSDNYTWTKWGTTRTHTNGGLMGFGVDMWVNGDGTPGITAEYWKVFVIDAPTDDSGTVGLTEMSANTA